jgi:hypothetical protein
MRPIIAKRNTAKDNAQISSLLGNLWSNLEQAEKHEFIHAAEQEKQMHKLAFPDYKYHPKPPKKNKDRQIPACIPITTPTTSMISVKAELINPLHLTALDFNTTAPAVPNTISSTPAKSTYHSHRYRTSESPQVFRLPPSPFALAVSPATISPSLSPSPTRSLPDFSFVDAFSAFFLNDFGTLGPFGSLDDGAASTTPLSDGDGDSSPLSPVSASSTTTTTCTDMFDATDFALSTSRIDAELAEFAFPTWPSASSLTANDVFGLLEDLDTPLSTSPHPSHSPTFLDTITLPSISSRSRSGINMLDAGGDMDTDVDTVPLSTTSAGYSMTREALVAGCTRGDNDNDNINDNDSKKSGPEQTNNGATNDDGAATAPGQWRPWTRWGQNVAAPSDFEFPTVLPEPLVEPVVVKSLVIPRPLAFYPSSALTTATTEATTEVAVLVKEPADQTSHRPRSLNFDADANPNPANSNCLVVSSASIAVTSLILEPVVLTPTSHVFSPLVMHTPQKQRVTIE